MKHLFLFFFLLLTTTTFAQNQNSVWCFGDSAGIDFSSGIPVTFESGMDGRGSCASISDSSGHLLFYANTYTPLFATYVWNAQNDTMEGGTLLGDGVYNELQIIPFPDQNDRYYLFQRGAAGFVDGIFYSIIDISANGGEGAVVLQDQQINNSRIADCMQAVKHANGRDWWLITKLSNINASTLNQFIVYLISPQGISSPVFYDFGGATDLDFQKIIFNSQCNKMMNIGFRGYMAEFDFDRCSGVVSNPHVIYPEITSPPLNRIFWEGSYAPNDSVFYTTTNRTGLVTYNYLLQYNLYASDIALSCDTLDSTTTPIGPGAVRLAPDGKIYYSRAYENPQISSFPYADTMYNYINMNLSVINQPNNLGTSCDYQPFSFYLGGKRTYYGLPNNPNYSLGALTGSVCDTLGLSVAENKFDFGFRVFPNPVTNGRFNVSYLLPQNKSGTLEIFDVNGKRVYAQALAARSSQQQIHIPKMAEGMYQCILRSGNEIAGRKVVVVREGRER